MRVAITGTTGYLGRYVVDELLTAGHTVSAQVRRELEASDPLTNYNEGLELCYGDLANTDSLEQLIQNCDAIVHMAFVSATGTYRGGEGNDPAWFWDQNFGGTLRLLEACRESRVGRFIFLSSRAVFDGCNITNRLVQDTDAPNPVNHYGLLKVVSEQLADLYSDITFCSLRPTGIYGLTWPYERTKWWNLISAPKTLERESSSFSNIVTTEVHGADVASAVLVLLQEHTEKVNGLAFNCSDVLVSDRYLVQLCQSLRRGLPAELNQTQLQPPINVMGTEGLEKLGWTRGGEKSLHQSLQEIIEVSEQL